VTQLRIGQAAELLGVSVDTVRRLVDAGQVAGSRTEGGQRHVDGASLAAYLVAHADAPTLGSSATRSARNRFTGLVTKVTVDGLIAQVEIQAGAHRIVSILTSEAVADLGLEPGAVATASVKATSVVVEVPQVPST
jgi:molybdopterin-binding protein